jgi:hypothetical protein
MYQLKTQKLIKENSPIENGVCPSAFGSIKFWNAYNK